MNGFYNLHRYILLPLALRSLAKIEGIIDDEMKKVGAQKVSMPLMLSSDLWKKTVRHGLSPLDCFVITLIYMLCYYRGD